MSAAPSPPAAPPAGTPEEVALQAALASTALHRAPALRRLLLYLWEHRDNLPGEYAIGVDVLGRREDFDPRNDATVRVHVARLRTKLKEFFETGGRGLPVELVIPAGAHRVEVRYPEVPAALPATLPCAAPGSRRAVYVLLAVCAVLTATVVWLWMGKRQLEQQVARTPPGAELPAFWRRLLGNGKLTRILIPTPVFVAAGPLRVRDVLINDAERIGESAGIRLLTRGFNNFRITETYSVASDSLALATLTRTLAPGNLPLTVGATKDLSLELFGRDNLIFLGVPPTSRHVEDLLSRTEFYIAPVSTGTVKFRHPRPGEPKALPAARNDHKFYGIISVLPGQAPGTRLVLLSGRSTSSLAAFLSSPVTLRELDAYLSRNGNPEYFELVVGAEVDGFNLQKGHLVAFRPVPATLWKQGVTEK